MSTAEEARLRPVFLCAGPRTPFAKIDGPLAHLDAVALSVPVVRAAVKALAAAGDERGRPDLVVWGAVIPSLSVSHIAREVWLDAALDPGVPAVTVVQQCATSLAAATHAAAQARVGRIDLALCGGAESPSRAQVGLTHELSRQLRRCVQAKGAGAALRALAGLRLSHLKLEMPRVRERRTGLTMGDHAELTAKAWAIDRAAQDTFALASHRRAIAARERGFFDDLIIQADEFPALAADTVPRADTTIERLAALPPAFDRKSGRGTLTAGNSSPLTDGAAACWVATERGLARFASPPDRARLVDWEVTAVDIDRHGLLMAPALAIPRLLARHGLAYADIGLWEMHEAFAAQVLATIAALNDRTWVREQAGVAADLGGVPAERINLNGGSVALGHPFGATGARIVSQAVKQLQETGGFALISICAAGGLGHVALMQAP
jgi:acetyl-CoA C-acetyltransferase